MGKGKEKYSSMASFSENWKFDLLYNVSVLSQWEANFMLVK
jgi:hypothetical protein